MTRAFILLTSLVLVLGGCSQARIEDLEGQVADLQSELSASQSRVAELESELDDAKSTIEAGQSAFADIASQSSEVQSATADLMSASARLGFENWQDVVPDIQRAANDVDSAAGGLHSSVSSAETALQ